MFGNFRIVCVARSAGFFLFFLFILPCFSLLLFPFEENFLVFLVFSQYNKTIRRPFFKYHLLAMVIGGQEVGYYLLRVGEGRLDERFVTVTQWFQIKNSTKIFFDKTLDTLLGMI